MIKRRKKSVIYSFGQKEFNTFKEMKSYIWYNSHTDEETQGFELINNVVQKLNPNFKETQTYQDIAKNKTCKLYSLDHRLS